MITILILLGLIAVLVGLLSIIYPAIPGLGPMSGGVWLLVYADSHQVYSMNTLTLIDIVVALGTAVGYVSDVLGAKYTGASKQALWDAFIGGITDTFPSLPGLLLGPLIGAEVGELIAKRDMLQAGKVSLGTSIGFIIGMIVKVGCVLAIVLTLLLVWIFNLFT